MSGRRQSERLRHKRPPSLKEDEDEDFQYALKLSAELNGDIGGHVEAAAAAAKLQDERNAAYEHTLIHFNDESVSRAGGHTSSHALRVGSSSRAAPQDATGHSSAMIIDAEDQVPRVSKSLSEFQDYMRASECTTCGSRFLGEESDVTSLFDEFYSGTRALSSLLDCKHCGTSSCIACQSTDSSRQSLVIFENNSVSWCCTNGRLLLIWILLCGFDGFYCETTRTNNAEKAEAADAELQSQHEPTEKAKGKAKGKAKAMGKGKGKAKAKAVPQTGIGYGGSESYSGYTSPVDLEELDKMEVDEFETLLGGLTGTSSFLLNKMRKSWHSARGPGRTISDDRSKAFEAQQALDTLATTVLSLLAHLLPSLDRGHAFDMDPPAMIPDILLESKLLDYCADMLRNDSLDDAISRKRSCKAVLDFVKVLGTHHVTAQSTVFSRRPQQPEQCNLLTQTYHHIEHSSRETATSIADNLHELNQFSDLFLKNAKHHQTGHDADNDHELLSLCYRIRHLWKLLCLSMPASKEGANDLSSAGAVASVSDVTDDKICTSHAFAARMQAQFRSAPGRFKRLVSEVNILKTSLPPNIFVRHGESRLDVMKCVIVGPEGTPYENGMFEFDIFCPPTFPKHPPEVCFKGTGGGAHGINPNLYADGKVCLSLLGTWSGEPWKPGESTLLQVLVSLQAMVLCEQPWYNEPGREDSYSSSPAKSASEHYNRRLRELTVRLAMIDWLEKMPPIWEDVIKQHFQSNADKILRTVVEWRKQSQPVRRGTLPVLPHEFEDAYTSSEKGYGTILPKLNELLQDYGATVAVVEIPDDDSEPDAKKARIEGPQAGESQNDVTLPHGLIPHGLIPPMSGLIPHPGMGVADYGYGGMSSSNDKATSIFGNHKNVFSLEGTVVAAYRGRGSSHHIYSFGGRGYVLGGDAPPGPPGPPAPPAGGPESGRGRGFGRGTLGHGRGHVVGDDGPPGPPMLPAPLGELEGGRGRGHGRGLFPSFSGGGFAPDIFKPFGSLVGSNHSKGRMLGDGEEKAAGGGRGGHDG